MFDASISLHGTHLHVSLSLPRFYSNLKEETDSAIFGGGDERKHMCSRTSNGHLGEVKLRFGREELGGTN